MQRYHSNGDHSYEGEKPRASDEASTAPTEQLYPAFEDDLPPLPPRPVYPRPYQPPIHERPAAAPEIVYDGEPEPPRAPGNAITFTIAKFNQFLTWLLWVIEVMFALRFFLTFFATSDSNAFISLLTSITDPLLAPFKTALRVQDTGVEWYILLAMLVYFLVILALIRFLRLFVTEPEL
ncbi:MAG TPA: YggT family protein [Ktedonobacterales bacterium]|nr:YggT family protein [Ktedonobacterales bacterium]